MKKLIRIGSRESRLAVIQAEIVRRQIEEAFPEFRTELVTMKTTGDRILDCRLDQVGGKGLFVKELDQALINGKIDISVHSLKDMPMEIPEELPLLAYTKREDPRDVLIYRPGSDEVPCKGIIGTSSKRRMLQLGRIYPECSFESIRGNVQTRMRKLETESYDATVLAAAGLSRLAMTGCIGRYFSTEEIIPAAGQGILAVQSRKGELEQLRELLNSPQSEAAAKAERKFVQMLDGGCSSPVAAYAEIKDNELILSGLYYRESDGAWFTEKRSGDLLDAEKTGEELAVSMRRKYGE